MSLVSVSEGERVDVLDRGQEEKTRGQSTDKWYKPDAEGVP